ncbi:MAG: homoserine dehydrogenase [Lautropia sp.]|nr:homoserine dehydrogenase [Lautropia sp.]
MKVIKVGLLGLGTVGGGVFEVLRDNGAEIARRAGRAIEVVRVVTRDVARARTEVGADIPVSDDPFDIVNDPEVDVLVEVMGGTTVAREVVLAAMAKGKQVVTANKALLAVHGNEIFKVAEQAGVMVAFEAAVAGGIPIVKALREGLAANQVESLAGIINGTTNFILSEMRDKGLSFDAALAEAQALGYAEADPTFDIEGVDAAHKATLLASMAFGVPVQFDGAYIEGISKLAAEDFAYADRLGYRIKLLGIARRRPDGIELRVHPTLIPAKRLLANVDGAMNAVWVKGNAVGETLYYGPGAGKRPTASAVVADLVDVARMIDITPEHRVPYLAFKQDRLAELPVLPASAMETAYYLRIHVLDEPGVLADITRILADETVSIDAMIQRQPAEGDTSTDIIIMTHQTIEQRIDAAIARIEALASVQSAVIRLRVEQLD